MKILAPVPKGQLFSTHYLVSIFILGVISIIIFAITKERYFLGPSFGLLWGVFCAIALEGIANRATK